MQYERKNKQKINIVLVGVGGYGALYVKDLLQRQDPDLAIVGVADPLAEKSPVWSEISHIDRYDNLTDCLQDKQADLVIISSPIQYHEQQVLTALDHGAQVLCEKPLCATVEQGERIIEKTRQTGLHVAVGFQWSFNPIIQKAKQDVLDGRYGALISMRTVMHWPRSLAYYQRNNWAGKIMDSRGLPVYDSVINNATAHYLHNMLYFLGESMDTSALPEEIEGRLWRGQPIENYDTAFVKMKHNQPSGRQIDLMMIASHLVQEERPPHFEFIYEHGRLYMENDMLKGVRYGEQGQPSETIQYGHPQGGSDVLHKTNAAIQAARTGVKPVCDAKTAFPHLSVINWLQQNCPITPVPAELLKVVEKDGTQWYYLPGLDQLLDDAAHSMTLPEQFVKT